MSSRTHQHKLIVDVIEFGDTGPFGLDFSDQREPQVDETFHSLGQAKSEADRRLFKRGHTCDKSCSGWIDSN
jgi:hypothetical protein